MEQLTDKDWSRFEADGFLKLGRVVCAEELDVLRKRLDDIMSGTADLEYGVLIMQLDRVSKEEESPGPMTRGFKGPSLNYRKLEGLEIDPEFLQYMRNPLFREICRQAYGNRPVSVFRAMIMNKPPAGGTRLQWHQDRWSHLDRDPLVTVYTSLDPATEQHGCLCILPGSHKWGLINPDAVSGWLTPEQIQERVKEEGTVHLELAAGEAVLLHNWLLHSSGLNRSGRSRRAFSFCVMDAQTQDLGSSGPASQAVLFGAGELSSEGMLAARQAGPSASEIYLPADLELNAEESKPA